MQITLSNDRDVHAQAIAAGFQTVEDYVTMLIDRDAERVAIQEGLRAIEDGRMRSLEEFEQDFRQRNHLAPQA